MNSKKVTKLLLTLYRWAQTDMGNRGARAFGAEQALIAVEQSVNWMIKAIHNVTREIHREKLWLWEGRQIPF
jgi:hypothetical protein